MLFFDEVFYMDLLSASSCFRFPASVHHFLQKCVLVLWLLMWIGLFWTSLVCLFCWHLIWKFCNNHMQVQIWCCLKAIISLCEQLLIFDFMFYKSLFRYIITVCFYGSNLGFSIRVTLKLSVARLCVSTHCLYWTSQCLCLLLW